MDAANELQQTIRGSIPLSEAMAFSIDRLDIGSIEVSAPLEPNVNIHGTGFAGSIYSLAVLTGWALATHIMQSRDLDGDLVVGRAEIAYRAPVTGSLQCRCEADEAEREAFEAGFHERGKGRLALEIRVGDKPEAVLTATFVAVAR